MRSARKIRRYDPAFRDDAIALVSRSEKPIEHIAQSLGMPSGTLYKWFSDHMAKKAKKAAARPAGDRGQESDAEKLARLEAENETLRKKVASLEEDKDILKKFAAFSVREKT